MLGRLANVTVSASGDKWFVSILMGRAVATPVASGPAVGIDMGIVRFARHIAKENRLSQSEFECSACGFRENADLVGAVNVLRAGHARLA